VQNQRCHSARKWKKQEGEKSSTMYRDIHLTDRLSIFCHCTSHLLPQSNNNCMHSKSRGDGAGNFIRIVQHERTLWRCHRVPNKRALKARWCCRGCHRTSHPSHPAMSDWRLRFDDDEVWNWEDSAELKGV
jgi:hypothetical protein